MPTDTNIQNTDQNAASSANQNNTAAPLQQAAAAAASGTQPFVPNNIYGDYFGVTPLNQNNRPQILQINAIATQQDKAVCRDPLTYATSGEFRADLAKDRMFTNRRTGIRGLDDEQPLYPGLYALGAVSSLGKTTLMLQIANNLAAAGVPVLYFSLEQSVKELYCKSLANTLNKLAENDPSYVRASASDIRYGHTGTRDLNDAEAAYLNRVGSNINFISSHFHMSVESIINITLNYIDKNPSSPYPVVIVDYLQILEPSIRDDGRINTDVRANTDHAVHMLKTFQDKYNLTVFVISSFNRENYINPVDFSSFKESGGIEYTADVVWGLQLSIITKHDFTHVPYTKNNGETSERETTLTEKREIINMEKAKPEREVELVVLKNRQGCSTYKLPLWYEPKYDTFYDDEPGSFTEQDEEDDCIYENPASPF